MEQPSSNPILVEVMRGTMAESWHRGAIVVVDANGKILHSWGNTLQSVYPHSSIKPIQALSLIESGTYDAYNLGLKEIALACASHTAEEIHTNGVQDWMDKVDVALSAFECGAHAPLDKKTRQNLFNENRKPEPIHNTCSGKHMGFITTAKHLGQEIKGYTQRIHPVQQRTEKILSELCDYDLSNEHSGIDGCGIPVVSMPLFNLALGMARFSSPDHLPSQRTQASSLVIQAMREHPFLVGGHEKMCSKIMDLCPNIILKDGNEGLYTASLLDKKIGIALKIDDGSLKAADVAMVNLIHKLGYLTKDLENHLSPEIRNFTKTLIGHYRPTL